MEITLNKTQLFTGAAALVVTVILTYGITLMGAGAQAQDADHIKAVVNEILKTPSGLAYGAALADNTLAISNLTQQLASDQQGFAEFRREYREDQRILQAALRELASEP